MIKRKITIIFVVCMAFTSFVSNHAFSQETTPAFRALGQGKIHLGPLKVYTYFGERVEVDDNVFQVSGKGTTATGGRCHHRVQWLAGRLQGQRRPREVPADDG